MTYRHLSQLFDVKLGSYEISLAKTTTTLGATLRYLFERSHDSGYERLKSAWSIVLVVTIILHFFFIRDFDYI